MKIIKFVYLIFILSYFASSFYCIGILSQSELEKNLHKNKLKKLKRNNISKSQSQSNTDENTTANLSKDKEKELPNLAIYFEGWIKYLHIATNNENKPKNFFKNELYSYQTKFSQEDPKKILIPSEINFYAILYKNSLNILSSRDDIIQRTIDVLNIDFIKPIPEGDNLLGGVRDFGKFNEGFCFRVLTKEPSEPFVMSESLIEPKNGLEKKWIFCLDDLNLKNKLMNLLIKLKLKKQHDLGIFVELDSEKNVKDKSHNTISTLQDNMVSGAVESSNDGRWILIQDWSQCTLKCGGGKQYQQLMCVPPRNGGKPCQGDSIRSRPCNTEACPVVKEKEKPINLNYSENKSKDSSSSPAPIIRIMPISNRPNRYDKCVIKEGDAFMVKKDKSTQNFTGVLPKIPVKIILNAQTFTIFQDDNYTNLISSFIIKETVFARVNNEPRCFILKNKSNSLVELCQLDSSNSSDWVDEWDYDYNLFKYQCFTEIPISDRELKKKEEKELKKEFIEKVNLIKMDMINEKKEIVQHKAQEDEEIKFENKIISAKQKSMIALKKEIKLEGLIEEEEKSKEEVETQEMQLQIENEEKKTEVLMRAIKEKQLEDQFNLSKSKAEESIQQIGVDTKKKIAEKRMEVKKKIIEMRKTQGKLAFYFNFQKERKRLWKVN